MGIVTKIMPEAPLLSPEEFKTQLRELGFTQGQFADYIGVNVRSVNDWGSSERKRGRGTGEKVRLGPPPYIVRLIRHMQRGQIDFAPVNPTRKDAREAMQLAVSAICLDAALKEWPSDLIAQALVDLGTDRLAVAQAKKAAQEKSAQ